VIALYQLTVISLLGALNLALVLGCKAAVEYVMRRWWS
jgi:hypothetical protein